MTPKKTSLSLDSFLDEIANEVDKELESKRTSKLSPDEIVLSQLASEILRLERDMTKPGQAVQESTRIDRLAKFIEEARF
jgi:hypothetical protein